MEKKDSIADWWNTDERMDHKQVATEILKVTPKTFSTYLARGELTIPRYKSRGKNYYRKSEVLAELINRVVVIGTGV